MHTCTLAALPQVADFHFFPLQWFILFKPGPVLGKHFHTFCTIQNGWFLLITFIHYKSNYYPLSRAATKFVDLLATVKTVKAKQGFVA